ncbi:maleylacetate reductase [Nesterenkonia muleiensis]|uniref:maleylacetate reductase n=1 Tax=Nesterenkonia muleiensis TaxID=2282648 RepID=UPI000E77352F
MTMRFTHQTLGQRVLFGAGNTVSDLVAESERISAGDGAASRIMLIVSDSVSTIADAIEDKLPVAHRHRGARRHVPVEDAHTARHEAEQADIDLILCLGGGSAVGLAKAVALTAHLPIIAVPTTYAGSEATNVWGMTENGRKTTGVDDAVLPASVIYDADLVRDLPAELTVASGINALAHSIDSMWAPRANPINQAWATEAMRALAEGLPQVAHHPAESREGRQQMQYGAYLSAVAFASAGSALHHKICHVLGGAFDLPHAQTHSVVLPYVLAFNAPATPEAAVRIAAALGAEHPVEGLQTLRQRIDAPQALRDHGLKEEHLEEAAQLVLGATPETNPRHVTSRDAERLVYAMWAGEDPGQLTR